MTTDVATPESEHTDGPAVRSLDWLSAVPNYSGGKRRRRSVSAEPWPWLHAPQALHVRFTLEDAERASEEWRFNCGPSALCAALKLRPGEIRRHMGDFEAKGYTNPTLMFDVLKRLNVPHHTCYRSDRPDGTIPDIHHGLMRVQWGGRWTKPGVPMRVRYRKTHWVALAKSSEIVFDVNAMCVGGWLTYNEWAMQLVPWLIRECEPESDGTWWPTHVIAIRSDAEFTTAVASQPTPLAAEERATPTPSTTAQADNDGDKPRANEN